MSFLINLFYDPSKKKPIQMMNPLYRISLPDTKEELQDLQIKIAREMSEVNVRLCTATQKMMEATRRKNTNEICHQILMKAQASDELRTLSQQLMDVVRKQTEIIEAERQQ